MSEEVIVVKENCFICGGSLNSLNFRSVMESTNSNYKPIYKYLESFVGKRLHLPLSTKASICNLCLTELHEYDEVCKRATQIQEHISEVFKKTQKKLKVTKNFVKCDVCLAQYISKEAFDKHECVIDEGGADDDICEILDDEYEDYKEAGTSRERRKMDLSAQYMCNTCNKTFERKRDYEYHAKVAHLPEGTKILSCDSCQKSQENIFTSELELKLHIAIHHTELKDGRYQCPECEKSFNSKHVLIRHFNIHSMVNPMICDICGKTYFHVTSFNNHLVVHTGVRPYTCNQCGKSFVTASLLTRHNQTHTGIKPFECFECGSRFARKHHLKTHMNIHLGTSRKRKLNQPLPYNQFLE